jgi:membrane protein YdbS with pleckstrin-like domain
MLMTRFLFTVASLLLCSLNAAALWQLLSTYEQAPSLAAAALVVNAVIWPLALVVAYRIGQATDAEAHRKAKAKARQLAARV